MFKFVLAVVTAVLVSDHGPLFSAEPYLAGVAARNVTPDYPIRLNGFGIRREESEGVSQPIWARALALRSTSAQPQDAVVIVTLDNLGIRLSMVDEVGRRVQARSGLPGDRIAFTFTHTHSAPKVNGASDNIFSMPIPPEHQAHIDRYTAELTDALEAVILDALNSMQPATLEWGVGEVGFAMNRRTAGGPTDHSLPVLVVRNERSEIKAVYTSYACHCVTLSFNQLSGDWAGYAASSIERLIPGCTALISIGCGSDQNPSSGVTGDKTAIAEQQGVEIGSQVQKLIQDGLRPLSEEIRFTNNRIPLDFNTIPSREQYEALVAAGGPLSYNAKTQLEKLNRGETLPTALIYPIQTISFGKQLLMVFLGGEVCVDYAIRLRTHLDASRLWIHGYSNDFGAYIPSERLVVEGGYGGGAEIPYFALPTTLSAGLEQKIVTEVLNQSPDEFNVPEGTQGVPPKSPADSLKCMQTHPELRVELVAAEPLITDPVAIDFGPDGKLWVCQMNDYAHGVEDEFPESSEIRMLSDTNHDGQFDQSDVFVDGLRYPTDVKVWRNGVLICDAPHIYFAADTDGDNKADVKRILFTGFATHNGQARVNSLQWGLDHWLYASSGLFGGKIRNEHGVEFDVTDRDFRLNPDTGVIEPVTGRTQQSRVRDDWNNWFGCDNSNLIRSYPVEESYSRRNPFVRPAPTAAAVMTGDNPGRLFPASNLVLFKLSGPPGIATAACGVGIYRDNILGPDYSGNSFTCEPVNQLLFRQVLARDHVLVLGKRAANEQASDFLTSTDRWFRPVQARTGPDGALYIVDMYRYVIEHPRWIPDETLAELNVFAGNDRGRIYRVVPASKPLRPTPVLNQLSPVELAQAIDTPNGVIRDLVHQMLMWNRPADQHLPDVIEKLTAIATSSSEPAARLSALCTLDGIQGLTSETLISAFRDPHEEVRRHALRIAERFDDADVLSAILECQDDSSPVVRLQLANTLGELDLTPAGSIIAQIVLSAQDPWTSAAAMSSINKSNLGNVLKSVLSSPNASQDLKNQVLTTAAGLGDKTVIEQTLSILLSSETTGYAEQVQMTMEFLTGLDRRSQSPELVLNETVRTAGRELQQKAADLLRQSAESNELIENEEQQRPIIASLSLLTLPRGPVSTQVLGKTDPATSGLSKHWLAQQIPIQIQEAVVDALSTRGAVGDLGTLISRLPSTTPSIRTRIMRAILSRNSWQEAVVEALEAGQLTADHFSAADREQFLTALNTDLRDRASKHLSPPNTNRTELVRNWQDVLQLKGNLGDGRAVFAKRCSVCHKLENTGFDVGPNLAALTTRSSAYLLAAILDPNRDVDARYNSYVAVLDDGRTVNGILTSETTTGLTLREQEGKEHVLLRNQIEEFRNTGRSAMPEGIEKDVSKQQMADLLTYLLELGPPPKSFAGNHPETILISSETETVLPASAAGIFGGDIAFESDSPFRNIGYWHGANDTVVWTVQNSGADGIDHRFDLWLDYSCHDSSAGNTLMVNSTGDPLPFEVPGTGGWDRYRFAKIGSISLPAGTHRISLYPDRSFRGPALLDLRAVILTRSGEVPAMASTSGATAATLETPTDIANRILDDSVSSEEREQLIAAHPQHSAALIRVMAEGLGKADDEEYRRIPWIWRVAIAAGKRNEGPELLEILDVSLPKTSEPLRDWQSVVIGGGIVNGISQQGIWPRERLDRLIAGNEPLSARWDHTIAQSSKMADNENVRTGTRYDALRIIAMETFELHGRQLVKYLSKGINDELQMGAISGLSDMPAADAGIAITENLPHFSDYNRSLALAALLRTNARALRLLSAIDSEKIPLQLIDAETRSSLLSHPSPDVQQAAAKLFGNLKESSTNNPTP